MNKLITLLITIEIMKVIVSSNSFSSELKKINLNGVRYVKLDHKKYLTVGYDRASSIVIPVESSDKPAFYYQADVRWDWLISSLTRIADCPVVIEFLDNKCTVSLSF